MGNIQTTCEPKFFETSFNVYNFLQGFSYFERRRKEAVANDDCHVLNLSTVSR